MSFGTMGQIQMT